MSGALLHIWFKKVLYLAGGITYWEADRKAANQRTKPRNRMITVMLGNPRHPISEIFFRK
jgi:hypothetical protein